MPRGTANLLLERREKPDTLSYRVRKARKISQRDLADEMGVNEETIRRWESGKHAPNRWLQPQLEAIAKRHKVNMTGL